MMNRGETTGSRHSAKHSNTVNLRRCYALQAAERNRWRQYTSRDSQRINVSAWRDAAGRWRHSLGGMGGSAVLKLHVVANFTLVLSGKKFESDGDSAIMQLGGLTALRASGVHLCTHVTDARYSLSWQPQAAKVRSLVATLMQYVAHHSALFRSCESSPVL